MLAALIVSCLVVSTVAFQGTHHSPLIRSGKVSELKMGLLNLLIPDLEVLEGVHLPKSVGFIKRVSGLFDLQIETNVQVVEYATSVSFNDLENKPKEDSFELAKQQQIMINKFFKENVDDPPPVAGYLYFGNKNFAKQLSLLCQVNPFFASALTVVYEGGTPYLELKAYDENEKDPAKYLEFTRLLTDASHRVNVRFNMDMTINKITNYANGKEEIVEKKDYDYFASGAIYNVIYYVSAYHATIHVLMYLMTTCIVQSCDHNKGLAAWAEPYDDNIPIKYVEVAALLIQSGGINLPGQPDDKIVTGANGFGASEAVKPPLREILCTWGACKTATDFMNNFLLSDIIKTATKGDATAIMEQAGILTEFKKHIADVQPFADELSAAFKKADAKALDTTEQDIKKFMSGTGEGVSSIDSVSSWVQLITCTGMTHGSTLSYTRLLGVPEIMRWRDINSKIWQKNDVALMTGGLGTIAGMTIDRHVFTNKMTNGKKWDTSNVPEGVQDVLLKYDDKATALKEEYKAKLLQDPEELREYGFITTDHCPDGYDGKQHTITTYI